MIGMFNRRGMIYVKDKSNEWRKVLSIRKYSTDLFLVMYLHKAECCTVEGSKQIGLFLLPHGVN